MSAIFYDPELRDLFCFSFYTPAGGLGQANIGNALAHQFQFEPCKDCC
jgi:hypothetical protein